jgi:hypothetical protein
LKNHDNILIEVKAERFPAHMYVIAAMFISCIVLPVLAYMKWIDAGSSWQWWVLPALLSVAAYWLYRRHTAVLRITEIGNGKFMCSVNSAHYQLEDYIDTIDYWSTYKGEADSLRVEMKIIQLLEIKTLTGESVRLKSNGADVNRKPLMKNRSFSVFDRVYTVDDVEEIVTALRQNQKLVAAKPALAQQELTLK